MTKTMLDRVSRRKKVVNKVQCHRDMGRERAKDIAGRLGYWVTGPVTHENDLRDLEGKSLFRDKKYIVNCK